MKFEYSNTKISLNVPIEEIIKKCVPFFIRSLFRQREISEKRYEQLVMALEDCQKTNGWENFSTKKLYFNDIEVVSIFNKMPFFIRNKVKKLFIETYDIYSYERNNVFFAGLSLFDKEISRKDISLIYERFYNNNQAITLISFLEDVRKHKPKLLSGEVISYLEAKQK